MNLILSVVSGVEMKPICPIFCEPCLENLCSAFMKKEKRAYTVEGYDGKTGEEIRRPTPNWLREPEMEDFCGMFNRVMPNKVVE